MNKISILTLLLVAVYLLSWVNSQQNPPGRGKNQNWDDICKRWRDLTILHYIKCQSKKAPCNQPTSNFAGEITVPCDNPAPSAGVLPPEPVKLGKKFISAEALQSLKSSCGRGKCNKQSLTANKAKEQLASDLADGFNFPKATAEYWLQMNYNAKKALFKRDGLDFVEPTNDGTFSGILVTPTQAAVLMSKFATEKALSDLPASGKRRKRYAMFLESEVAAKWALPISYVIPSSFSSYQRGLVLNAINEIHAKTCIDFVEKSSQPAGAHMYFQSTTNPGICGLSFMGRISPYNQIFLNFGAGCANIIKGTVIHEILHALGVEHQQARYDRDDYIRINWDNIDPQAYDYYAIQSHTATSYGIEFDYLSVMLYGPKTGSNDYTKDAYTVLKNQWFYKDKVGQRVQLSDRDAQVLRKMYCSPGCSDYRIYCGWWATEGYCESYLSSMSYYCKKSCDLCPTAG